MKSKLVVLVVVLLIAFAFAWGAAMPNQVEGIAAGCYAPGYFVCDEWS